MVLFRVQYTVPNIVSLVLLEILSVFSVIISTQIVIDPARGSSRRSCVRARAAVLNRRRSRWHEGAPSPRDEGREQLVNG
eukprot:COSAG02_NODE_8239_length_2645_cov_11.536135_2_plen_80_part_00